MGRPVKITEAIRTKFAELVMLGNSYTTAAQSCGITPQTFRNWMHRGAMALDTVERGKAPAKTEQQFLEFYAAVKAAEGIAENALVGEVRGAASSDWRAAAWLLERRWSKRWGYKAQVDITVRSQLERMVAIVGDELGKEAADKVFARAVAELGEESIDTEGDTVH